MLIIPWLFEKRAEIVDELCFQLLLKVNEMTLLVLQSQNSVVPPMLYHCFVEKKSCSFTYISANLFWIFVATTFIPEWLFHPIFVVLVVPLAY